MTPIRTMRPNAVATPIRTRRRVFDAAGLDGVKGHWDLPVGGQFISLLADS